jgi:hypothetical protein
LFGDTNYITYGSSSGHEWNVGGAIKLNIQNASSHFYNSFNANNMFLANVAAFGSTNANSVVFGYSGNACGIQYQNYTTKTANYTIASGQDYIVLVDTVTAAGAKTMTFPSSPSNGECYIIKDSTGSANTYNITVAGNGKNIDGAANYVINNGYGSAQFIYNGSQWNVL